MTFSNTTRLRALVGDRKPTDDTTTFFSDIEIADLLEQSGSNLDHAAAIGWLIKAGEYSRLIDVEESGTIRKMSQKYKQAQEQAKHFQARAALSDEQMIGSAGRVVGKSIPWAASAYDEFPRVLFTPANTDSATA